jgi:signal transduction histidine kinase
MTLRMTFPSFVRLAATRIVLGGLVAASAIAVAGLVIERTQLGSDAAASRARLRAEVEGEFAALAGRLDRAVRAVTFAADTVRRAERGDAEATRQLFDQVAASGALTGVSVAIYGVGDQPVAWLGRSEEVPEPRRTGPPSLFPVQSSQGLQLVRVQPVLDPADSERHVGAIVAQTELPQTESDPLPGSEFSMRTSIVPVALRLQFEGASEAGPDAFVIRSATNEPLVAVIVSDADLRAARQRIRDRLYAAELGLAALLALLCAGPLLDWRKLTRSVWPATLLTLAIAALLLAARGLTWVAIRKADLAEFTLLPSTPWSWLSAIGFASPFDFLLNALVVAGLVVLAGSSFVMWRSARRPGLGVVVVDRPSTAALFHAVQLAAGVGVGALVLSYEWLLRTHVSQTPIDIVRFALDRIDPIRLPVIVGLIALNAAVFGLALLLYRLAWSPWVFPNGPLAWRLRAFGLWLLPSVVFFGVFAADDRAPQWPSLLVVVSAALAAWLMHRYAALNRHGSQALRLVLSFLAVALPSLILYPSLVDASERARRQLIESRYAPEVIDQRQDLHTKLQKALVEINRRIVALEELVRASDPPTTGPPPTDAAFLVWSQTSLATERLTSSIELHNASGEMVSRFAMNLPDFAQPQPWTESSCDWETLEEVAPLFSEERRLLHAGRALCLPGGRRAGSIVVHSMLDYGNLSFISAQNPYVALMRSAQRRQPRPRADVALHVYGWSRRVLYTSGGDAPPLTEDDFGRVYQSRAPFWTTIRSGSDSLDAFVMNDRGAIYVLTADRQNAFGHLVAEAELLAFTFLVFVAAVIAGMVFNLLVGRAPASGRALLAEVRASFYRKLFLAFVAAAIIPVLALALVSRAYMANLMLDDIEREATRLATVASRVFQDLRAFIGQAAVADDLIVWLSRVVAQDVNIFDGPNLLASSERNLFASGLLPKRTPGEVYRAIFIDGRPSFVGRERAGGLEYLIAATPVQIEGREAILTIPLASRQQETQAQIEELDRRVLLAAVLFIMLGAAIGYYMAERIADPVNRLMRATRRIARGDLDARVLATSSDELRRLVDAFNQMADDLQRQRAELERTNRLAAWADMARQVAHDIKNPLTPIQLNAEHLRRVHLDQGKPLGGVIDECVSNILGQVRLLRQISSEFSSFATSPEPRPVETSLADLVEEVVEPYRAGLAGRVAIDTHVPGSLPPLTIDRMLMGRALTNIIENALHAMPGGGTLTIDAALAPDRMVQLRVSDTGIGMDDQAISKIFEPYFSTKAIGTGLGLTIAKRNVEANRGTIAVTSEKGRGTSVTMTLPQT